MNRLTKHIKYEGENNMKFKKRLAVLLVLVMIISLAVGCTANSPTKDTSADSNDSTNATASADNLTNNADSSSANTVRIGVLLPFTGGSAAVAELQWAGYEFFTEHFNKNGGFSWGAQVEFVRADSNSDPSTGVNEITRLITEENVCCIIGPYNSSVGSATAPIAEKHEIPYLLTNCTEDSILANNYKYVFRANSCNSADCIDVITFINDLRDNYPDSAPKRFALVYENTDWGVGSAAECAKALEENGYEVVLNEGYEANMTDASSLVNKIKSSGADVVVGASYLADSILITNTLAQYKVDATLICLGGGFSMNEFIDGAGANAEGAISLSAWATGILNFKPAEATELNEEYKAKYGSDFDEYSANGYLGAAVLINAIESAGGTDKAAIRNALANMDLGPDAPELILHPYTAVKFSTEEEPLRGMVGQNIGASNIMVQVIDGEFKMVGPMSTCGKEAVTWPVTTWANR